MHFFCVHVHRHALLAGRLEGLRTSLDKQTSCLPHLFTSYSHNYTCSPRNHSDNRSTVPQKQKIPYCKTAHWTFACLLYSSLGPDLHNSSFTLGGHCQGLARSSEFCFYFCISVMIKMGFIIAQFDSHRQTSVKRSRLVSAWFVIFIFSGTWHGLHKPI